MKTICQKCGCEIDEMADCCPGCMAQRDLPAGWESCSYSQLVGLAEYGSYGQKLIARRWLIERAKEQNSDELRSLIKRLGPRRLPDTRCDSCVALETSCLFGEQAHCPYRRSRPSRY